MEPEEIAVVLSRASELHSKLSDAISFAVENAPSPSSSRIIGLQNGEATSELQSLAAIRDSLEVLEEQLESLQALQQQQRADRDAGLAEIEESRRVFLKRLSEYRGKELGIVQEALVFAGGNVLDKDELPAQGYPPPEDGESSYPLVSFPRGRYGSIKSQESHEEQLSRNQVFGFDVEEAQDGEGSEVDSAYEDEGYRDPDSLIRAVVTVVNAMKNSVVNSGAFAFAFNSVRRLAAFLGRFVGQISGQVMGPPSKVVLIVVSTLVVLSLTELGERRKSVARVSRMPAHRSHPHHIGNVKGERGFHANSSKSNRKPNSSKTILTSSLQGNKPTEDMNAEKLDDDFPKCVVRERLELPFYQELQTPDVLHGRG